MDEKSNEKALATTTTREFEVVNSYGRVLWRGRSMSPEFAILSGAHVLGLNTMQEVRNKNLNLRVREIRTVSVDGYYTVVNEDALQAAAAKKIKAKAEPAAPASEDEKNLAQVVTNLRLQIGSLKTRLGKYEGEESSRRGVLLARAAKRRMDKDPEFCKSILQELRSIIRNPADRTLFDFSPLNGGKKAENG